MQILLYLVMALLVFTGVLALIAAQWNTAMLMLGAASILYMLNRIALLLQMQMQMMEDA